MTKNYTFGEKKTEYNPKLQKEVSVWQSPKYVEAKKKAIETLESNEFREVLSEADFWILTGLTKSGNVAYNGLIISHNGCLKINDALPVEKKFKPSCLTIDKDGFNRSLVYTYCNDEQGIYEVGEVSDKNCTNAYPYAMALKRCMDRVILKSSKLAYAGIYSDSEAEEFKNEPKEIVKETTENEPNSLYCDVCKSKLVEFTDKKGNKRSPESFALFTRKNFNNKVLCPDCARKEQAKKAKEKKEEPEMKVDKATGLPFPMDEE